MLKRKRLIPEETKDEIEGYESTNVGEERMDVDDAVDAEEINPLGFLPSLENHQLAATFGINHNSLPYPALHMILIW